MALDFQRIAEQLDLLIEPNARARLLARGLARGMVWKNGIVPEAGPDFSPVLTSDLLDFGYGILALALELRDANRLPAPSKQFETTEALRVAAEAIESAVRRGDPSHGDQGRHLVVSATAFHLAGFAARSFSLLPVQSLTKNLASSERALGLLLRRDLFSFRDHIIQWLNTAAHTDEQVAARLADEGDEFGPDEAVLIALNRSYYRALGLADTSLMFGTFPVFSSAIELLTSVVTSSAAIGNVPLWWTATLSKHLLLDLWGNSLHIRIPSGEGGGLPARWAELRRNFIAQLGTRKPPHIDLWPSQLVAAKRAIDPADDLVIALPTSAGKTRIAELCILRCLADGKRVVYVTPLRALSAQVERLLARTFVPLGATVTSLYGASGATLVDTKTLASAGIVVATPEKLDFALRQDARMLDDIGLIVFDEGHMIGLGSREIRYEVLIQGLMRRKDAETRRIVCLSAMFNPDDPHFKDFGSWLRSDAEGDFIHVQWRPTRLRLATLDWRSQTATAQLSFIEGEKPFVPRFLEGQAPLKPRRKPYPASDLEFCICATNTFARDGHSVLVYCPQRSQVETLAREFRHMFDQGYLTDIKVPQAENLSIARAIGREWLGPDHPVLAALEVGVGSHHGSLPRPYLDAIEKLLDARQLSVVVASPTLAQGIDLACSVLLFRSLKRYEGGEWVPISPAEFGNVVGRAGRAYVDLDGLAVLPTFAAADQKKQHTLFGQLAEQSRGQRLKSGLALLIAALARQLGSLLGHPGGQFLEYVLNNRALWEDGRVTSFAIEEEEDGFEPDLQRYIADLDIAILSLVDDLETTTSSVATILDTVLNGSLWQRTLAHDSEVQRHIQRELLVSRAEWLWSTTTAGQRRACYSAGLGRKPGLFLHDNLEALVDSLCAFNAAVQNRDVDAGCAAANIFAEIVMAEPFFAVSGIPEDWKAILSAWVRGTGFATILVDRGARESQKVLRFVQDGAVFKLVWAAEAVRVQAIATDHPRVEALGDGPAFALTYGTPFVQAALLCQAGYSSRTGAVWASEHLRADITDTDGLYDWLRLNSADLDEPDFWASPDQYALWKDFAAPSVGERPSRWKHEDYTMSVSWKNGKPAKGTRVRVIGGFGRYATICNLDLTTLGTAELPFDPRGTALDGEVIAAGRLKVHYFGR